MTAETEGARAKRRRIHLGYTSVRKLEEATERIGMKVGRATITKIERGQPVEDWTRDKLNAALDALERRHNVADPEAGVNVVELPDGTKVTFSGSAEYVAEAAAEFLRRRGD